jgi:hypothetical protein
MVAPSRSAEYLVEEHPGRIPEPLNDCARPTTERFSVLAMFPIAIEGGGETYLIKGEPSGSNR